MREHTNGLSRRAFIGGAVMLGAASIVAPTTAFAATAAEKQAEADAVRNQLVGLQADLEAAADSYKQALDAQEVAQAAMEAEQVKIDEANGKIADLQDKLGTRARSMYRSGSSNFLDFVMGATSFEEFTQNWDLLNKMNENDGQMVDETKTLREELQASKDEYARQEKIAADKAAEAKVIQTEAEAKVAQATELREPHRIARYLESLAAPYHTWYGQCRVTPRGDDPVEPGHVARLWLNDAVTQVLRTGLNLLGVSAPERM